MRDAPSRPRHSRVAISLSHFLDKRGCLQLASVPRVREICICPSRKSFTRERVTIRSVESSDPRSRVGVLAIEINSRYSTTDAYSTVNMSAVSQAHCARDRVSGASGESFFEAIEVHNCQGPTRHGPTGDFSIDILRSGTGVKLPTRRLPEGHLRCAWECVAFVVALFAYSKYA